jgi:23S rRNA (uracil1939-C5)-methyltransferase
MARPDVQPAAARPERGAEIELRVDSLAHGGRGVARLDGYVVFVQGGVPGDRVRARVTKRKRDYAEALAVELLEPSADRVAPRAPHPGAPWQVLPYGRQLAEKERQVRDALERMGRFLQPPVAPIVPAVEPWRYRNKLEYSFGAPEDGGDGLDGLVLGFHRPGRWSEIDDVTDDVLASERIDALRERVKAWCRAEGLSAYDRRDHTGFLRNLVVREGRRTGQLQARLVTSPGDFRAGEFAEAAACDGVLWTRAAGVAETTREGETDLIAGAEAIEEEILGLRVLISPDAFFQTNTEMAERLYGEAGDLAALRGGERVFDLFSGIGTIAMALALRAGEVWGVELVERAVADAIENARHNGLDNLRFHAGDVRTALRPLVEKAGRPDVVVVDPPRAGLSQKVVRRVLETRARKVVYVSCNPTTLAPNARQMADASYRLSAVRPVDMFPQTPHIECVALLEHTA